MSQQSMSGAISVREMGRAAASPVRQRLAHRIVQPLVLAGLAVLLGRASIVHVVSPFAFAYFAVLTELSSGAKKSWPAWFGVVGAFLGGGWSLALTTVLEFVVYRIFRKALFPRKSPDIHWMPFLAGFVAIASHLAAVGTLWTRYDLMIAAADGALVIVLTLIFFQCFPLLLGKESSRALRHDQLVSLTIWIGSVLSGLAGLSIRDVSMVQVGVDWLVLLLASVGGAGVAAGTAVTVGILAMLSHGETLTSVAILSFAAVLAGVLKEAGRIWQGLAFLMSTTVLSVVERPDWHAVVLAAVTSGIGALLLVLTPKRALQELASYVPGTNEHKQSENERVRRVRELLSEKIHEVSQVFDELSATFADAGDNPLTSAQQLVNHVVGSAANTVCVGCARRKRCWDREGYQTYQAIIHTVTKLEASEHSYAQPTQDLKDRCIKLDSMMGVLRQNLEVTRRDAMWIAKLKEQRSLVSAQLAGVANVIRSVASEIDRDNESTFSGEEQVLAALEQLGMYVDHVHIVSLDPGKVEVEITQPGEGAYDNSVRVIAPLLSGIVGETITVSKVVSDDPGPCTSVFHSARQFTVKTAVATLTRDGRPVSGDTYTSVDLGNGQFAVAVSDGMGNGERARRESRAAIELLKRLLKAGFDEQLAVQTVNSTLLIRSKDEMFTTLDMALIDLFSAKAEFLKIGSAPSFIKRGDNVLSISGANVPIGILQDIEVQAIEDQLYDGDILIMMSDGIYDAPQHAYDKDEWVKRQIERLVTTDPQEIADTLIESAGRMTQGQINDDMTVLVAVISKYQPEWAAIKLPGVVGLRSNSNGRRRGA